jgi:hypothetical protein
MKHSLFSSGKNAATMCLGLFIICSFAMCKVKRDCPAYSSPAFDKWFPYLGEQKLVFLSPTGDRDTFFFVSMTKTMPYVAEAYSDEPKCTSEAEARAIRTDAHDYRGLRVMETVSENRHSTTVEVNGLGFWGAAVTDTGMNVGGDDFWISEHLSNYTLGGMTYPEVQRAFRSDTTGITTTVLYEIFFAPGKGVVGYQTYPDKVSWTLQ